MIDTERGTGRTTQQMLNAPHRAIFVWCVDRTDYARDLARRLGRTDLRIVSPRHLDERMRGLRNMVVVIDHAARLSDRQRDFLVANFEDIRR